MTFNNQEELQEIENRAVKEFAEWLKEYARACKASGYDGIGEEDIDKKTEEFCNAR